MLTVLHKRVVEALALADAAGATDVGISLDSARLKLEDALGHRCTKARMCLAPRLEPDRLH